MDLKGNKAGQGPLTRYELTAMISKRAEEIGSAGTKICTVEADDLCSTMDMARREIESGRYSMLVTRILPDGTKVNHRASELVDPTSSSEFFMDYMGK